MDATTLRGLFRGPQHIVIATTDDLERLTGFDPTGIPAREVWCDPHSRRVQAEMDATWQDGSPRVVDGVPNNDGVFGSVTIVRVTVEGRCYGVATQWTPSPVPSPIPSGFARLRDLASVR